MTDTPRAYRAICFDLDGTLLPMDLDAFMRRYFEAVYDFVAARGLDAGAFLDALKAGTRVMLTHDDGRTNAEAYWETFRQLMGESTDVDWTALMTAFYTGPFTELGAAVTPDPDAARALATLKEKGYPLVLTTMPMFPPEAVQARLAWAGIDPALFDRMTTYDNSTSVKPKGTYYAENLEALGVQGEEVLMVGNNTVEDLAFTELGADAYLVTDWLLDPTGGFDLEAVRHGSMADFAQWAQELPACERPATAIEAGAVGR
ncbi:HAD family hydrolase [Adlercreutzia muris]|uniref:HAD family hydrolase n=1 Tax=Adlercreutzia muris TaxID=1796610 RepID=UPI001F560B58|nr:HAD family hydrolase [Adlercreutzia muris]